MVISACKALAKMSGSLSPKHLSRLLHMMYCQYKTLKGGSLMSFGCGGGRGSFVVVIIIIIILLLFFLGEEEVTTL